MVLYGYWRSSCTYRVRIALALKNLKVEYKAINLVKGEQKQEGFSELSPNQTVPSLVVLSGGKQKVLNQSLAILEYLEEVHPSPALLPADPAARAEVRALCLMLVADTQPLQNLRVLHKLSPDQAQRNAWAHWAISEGFQRFEKAIAATAGQYCYGDGLTFADLCLVPQVYNALRFQVDLSAFPTISRVYQVLVELPAFKAAHPDLQPDAVVT
uniref:Maleylacetoacetate isomerase n=1 Tax=Arcella intermedia TaxID=1963864 RepID=A0A6B2LHY1_9EUKA